MRPVPRQSAPAEITRLLNDWSQGREEALERLLPLVIDKLRGMAARCLSNEPKGITWEPSDLVNQVFLRLLQQEQMRWESRAQFFSLCAEFARRTLVDRARRRATTRHGAETIRIPMDDERLHRHPSPQREQVDLLALNDALERLEQFDRRASQIVEQRFFVGLTIAETASVLGVSHMTVSRDWESARRWLFRELKSSPSRPAGSDSLERSSAHRRA